METVRTSLLVLLLGMPMWPLAAADLCHIEYSILLYHPVEGEKVERDEPQNDATSDIRSSRIVSAVQEGLRRTLLNYFALPVREQSLQSPTSEREVDPQQLPYLTVTPTISSLQITKPRSAIEPPLEATIDEPPLEATSDQIRLELRTVDLTLSLTLSSPTTSIADVQHEIALSLSNVSDEELPQQIAAQLSQELNSFLIATAGEVTRGRILYVDGDLVFVSLGGSDGLRLGDELLSAALQAPSQCRTGEDKGTQLFKVLVVEQNNATAQLIMGAPNAVINEPLELDRRYVALEPYASSLIDLSFRSALVTAGLRIYPIVDFFIIRPFGALELAVPVGRSTTLFPLHLYGGVELNWYIGPLLFSPRIGTGVALGLGLSNGQSFFFTHIGVIGSLTTSIWLVRDIGLSIDLGYGYWFGIYNSLDRAADSATADLLRGYGGILVGVGLRFKL